MEDTSEVSKKPKWFKRQWIVDVKAQHELIAYFIAMGSIFFFSGALATNALQRLITLKGNEWQYDRYTDVILLVILAAFIGVSIFIGIIISHRMAGPIIRLVREMEKAKRGEKVDKIEFRDKDYYKNLAHAFNDVVDQLNKIAERGDSNTKDRFKL